MTDPRIALVTTTINVPTVLRLYAEYAKGSITRFENFAIFVAGDNKTPHQRCADVVNQCGPNAWYLSPDTQVKLDYKCSDLLGWDTIGRRNIATLEALKWGADIIVLIDDDNIPMDESYFDSIISALWRPFSGLCVGTPECWFDPGQWQFPQDGIDPVCQRGFPQTRIGCSNVKPIVDVRIGVVQGLCLGDPDTSAVDRLSRHPVVHTVSQLYHAGIVVDPNTRTIFNSQNTAFVRELAPAMFMLPGVGRYDDIWASLICQRVMRERDMHVHFGQPFVWQERNAHNLISDLKAEMFGMEHVLAFAQHLDSVRLPAGQSVVDSVRTLYLSMKAESFWPDPSPIRSVMAWLDDVASVL